MFESGRETPEEIAVHFLNVNGRDPGDGLLRCHLGSVISNRRDHVYEQIRHMDHSG